MKYMLLLWIGVLGVMSACHETTEGFLLTENASYAPNDTLYIRKTLDPKEDAVRIKYNAPWVTLNVQGVEGTDPIIYSVESVISDKGTKAAEVFREKLEIQGGGIMRYPLKNEAELGTYKVFVRVTNRGYSQVLKAPFTFIVVE